MQINFAMWRKAAWELIKMDDRKEWESLDIISKWLIATRSAVTTVTIYSCIIAGLLAWRDGNFSWLPWSPARRDTRETTPTASPSPRAGLLDQGTTDPLVHYQWRDRDAFRSVCTFLHGLQSAGH